MEFTLNTRKCLFLTLDIFHETAVVPKITYSFALMCGQLTAECLSLSFLLQPLNMILVLDTNSNLILYSGTIKVS